MELRHAKGLELQNENEQVSIAWAFEKDYSRTTRKDLQHTKGILPGLEHIMNVQEELESMAGKREPPPKS